MDMTFSASHHQGEVLLKHTVNHGMLFIVALFKVSIDSLILPRYWGIG